MPNLSDAHQELANSYQCPFFTVSIQDFFLRNGLSAIKSQGTLTLIDHEGTLFGITNEHVLRYHVANQITTLLVMGLRQQVVLPVRSIKISTKQSMDCPYDIGIVQVPRKILEDHPYKSPVAISAAMPGQNEVVVSLGYAAELCHDAGSNTIAHPTVFVQSTVQGVSDRNILLHDRFQVMDKLRIEFGGMSGGPVLRLDPETEQFSLCGIRYEGKEDHTGPLSELTTFACPVTHAILTRLLAQPEAAIW